MAGSDELLVRTFSARRLGNLIVFVCQPGLEIADDDWAAYVEWLKALQRQHVDLAILTAPGGRAPSSAQRSLLNRELESDHLRLAVLLSDWKLVPIVRVSSWFMKGAEPFRADELEKALDYLGERHQLGGVRNAIREFGGMVVKAARSR